MRGVMETNFNLKLGLYKWKEGVDWPNPTYLKPKPQPYNTVIFLQYGGGGVTSPILSQQKMGLLHEKNIMFKLLTGFFLTDSPQKF